MRRLVLMLILPAACRSGAASAPDAGEIAVEWRGTSQGRLRAPATARWCARDTLLELFAVRNDTAAGFALLPKDSLTAGGYSVHYAEVFIPLRPQATVAVRWLDQIELKGFEGATGVVTVTEAGTRWISGSVEASLRRAGGTDTIRLTGRFSRVPVAPAGFACGRANRPGAG